jgi:CheY-like chemotaxis protein
VKEPILVVDDNPANATLLTFLLEEEGYQALAVSDAQQALARLESFEPVLILMDIQLPGMDGLELTRRLKANERWRNVLIVALTAYAMKGDEERARAAGCDAYISKPIDTRTLPARIAELLAVQRPKVGS